MLIVMLMMRFSKTFKHTLAVQGHCENNKVHDEDDFDDDADVGDDKNFQNIQTTLVVQKHSERVNKHQQSWMVGKHSDEAQPAAGPI